MIITFYRSRLCPRCYMASKNLKELSLLIPEISVEEIDVLRCPAESWKNGVRMIPALKIDGDILSGIYLTKESIETFVRQHLTKSSTPITF